MLRTMDEGYKVIALHGEKLNPLKAFWQLTRGNAEALSIARQHRHARPRHRRRHRRSRRAATPAMALRMETVETLAEELFLLQTLGDDRAIAATYVMGERVQK